MLKTEIEHVIAHQDLSFQDAHQVMMKIMNGEVNQSQIAALLTALKMKGETPEEVAGFATAMRDKSIKINYTDDDMIDVCGTGGDYSGTFNISTASAFVVAGAGIRVAKHGNRSISSASGSADVLKELGININLKPDSSAKALQDIGITFLFAPDYHPAMKYAAPVRKELGLKTVFNILGPLTNPAGTKKQLIGTFDNRTAEIMSQAAGLLDMKKVCFICTANKYDEVLLSDPTKVYEYSQQAGMRNYTISNETFDYPKIDYTHIKGKSPAHNAELLNKIFSGKEKGAPHYVTVANAAMGLYSADYASDINTCVRAAQESILSGKAFEKLKQLRDFGKQHQ